MGEWILLFMLFWGVIVSLFALFARRIRSLPEALLLVVLTSIIVFMGPFLLISALVDTEASREAEERYGVEFVLEEPPDSTELSKEVTPEERKHSRLMAEFFLLGEGEFMTVEYTVGESEETGVVMKSEGEFVLLDSDGREHVKEDA